MRKEKIFIIRILSFASISFRRIKDFFAYLCICFRKIENFQAQSNYLKQESEGVKKNLTRKR